MCDAQPDCNVKGCKGENELRHFADWSDLSAHLNEETIVACVNRLDEIIDEYLTLKERDNDRKMYHKSHQEKRKRLEAAAKALLDPDELKEIERQAKENVAARSAKAGRDER